MPRPKTHSTPVQLDRFQGPPTTPAWQQLPADVRARTRTLFARRLQTTRRDLPIDARDEEVGDA